MRRMNIRVQSQTASASGKSLSFIAQVPASLTDEALAQSLESSLLHEVGRVEVEFSGD